MVQGTRQAGRTQNYSLLRLAALEARAIKRANIVTTLYLPVIFFAYGFLLGRNILIQNLPAVSYPVAEFLWHFLTATLSCLLTYTVESLLYFRIV